MPLASGDEIRFAGASGTVVAVTATTDANGRGSIVYAGDTYRFRVLRASKRGTTEFPYTATNDLYFRVGLVLQDGSSPALYCLVFDDLPAPLGWGRWVQGVSTPGRWGEASEFAAQDSVVMTVGWRPGTITIKKGGVAVNGGYADIVLTYATSEGEHEAWWQPAYPYNELVPDPETDVPLRGPGLLGLFKTDAGGVLWYCRPDGTLEDIIFPRGIGALGNRLQDRWTDGPEPERYLSGARVYYHQEWATISEAATTLDVAAVSITVTGPANGYVVLWLYDGFQRGLYSLGAGGTHTFSGLAPGTYAIACYHPSDDHQGLPRQSLEATSPGGTYTVDFGSSWTVVPANHTQGVLYLYGATPAAGVTIYGFSGGTWIPVAVTAGDGSFSYTPQYGTTVAEHPQYGAVEWGQDGWRDASLGARISCIYSVGVLLSEGVWPWGYAGAHANLVGRERFGYWRNETTGEKYYVRRTPSGHGTYSDPMPRWRLVSGWQETAPPAQRPATPIQYRLYDMDGTYTGILEALQPDYHPPWAALGTLFRCSNQGNFVAAVLGGKCEGSVVEADRRTEIVVKDAGAGETALPEAARIGLEFGKWTQPLEHRSFSQTAADNAQEDNETFIRPLTFGDWECPYCGGPVWCRPSGAYARGVCMQCADFGITTDARSYLITKTLTTLPDWLDTTVKATSAGGFAKVLVKGWPRPEDYDESDPYLVDDWQGFGIPRWRAIHLILGGFANGVFSDGESIADAETRLGRTVGPVMLKLVLAADYAGSGKVMSVTATKAAGGDSETVRFTVNRGMKSGDLIPIRWLPHHSYPNGYWTDVTAMAEVSGDGAVYGQIVNDGPAWHGGGIIVNYHTHSPYACNVALSQRDPFLVEDFAGRLHLVYLRDGRVMRRTLEGTGDTWSAADDVTAQANWPHPCREPTLSPLPHGELVASAHSQETTRLWRSADDGGHWQ